MKVREIMTRNPATACVDSTVEEIATIMKEEDVGAIPILDEDDDLAGIITDRDIVVRCIAEGRDPSDWRAEDILMMKPELDTRTQMVYPDTDVAEATRIMALYQMHRVPVVENGHLVGMMSLAQPALSGTQEPISESSRKRSDTEVKNKGTGRKQLRISSPKKQGIANRNAGQQRARQGKVVTMRAGNRIHNERVSPTATRKKAS